MNKVPFFVFFNYERTGLSSMAHWAILNAFSFLLSTKLSWILNIACEWCINELLQVCKKEIMRINSRPFLVPTYLDIKYTLWRNYEILSGTKKSLLKCRKSILIEPLFDISQNLSISVSVIKFRGSGWYTNLILCLISTILGLNPVNATKNYAYT